MQHRSNTMPWRAKDGQIADTPTSTQSDKTELTVHTSLLLASPFVTVLLFSPFSFSFYCLINIYGASGCRLFFTESSLVHCFCPRRHTQTLKYTLTMKPLLWAQCQTISIALMLFCGSLGSGFCSSVYTVYVCVTGVLQHCVGRYNLNIEPELQSTA